MTGLGRSGRAIIGICVALGGTGVLIGFYIVGFLMSGPTPYRPPATTRVVDLTLQTVGAAGPSVSNPDWVSYYVYDSQGHHWMHTTIWVLPAHALVHVTLYQYDSATGLRNPFLARVRGTIGNVMLLNGKRVDVVDPNLPAHTFAVPALGLIVPLAGVADSAKNQCPSGPCSASYAHNTVTFSFRTPGPGEYRWQCFVPCAAGFIDGDGGPMATLGYMDGFLDVV